MQTFLTSARDWAGALDASDDRRRLLDAVATQGLPTTSDEVWRYAPLRDLDLNAFGAPSPAPHAPTFVESLAAQADIVIRVENGRVLEVAGDVTGVTVTAGRHDSYFRPSKYDEDAFALLNDALNVHSVLVTVDPGVAAGTVLIDHRFGSGASFPRSQVMVERGASVAVVEVWSGGAQALVVPVSEFHVGEDARLTHVAYQRLESSAWHIARTTARLERTGRMHQSVLSLGGHYDRARNDAELVGAGAENQLWTTYLGRGEQIHDLRSHQMHHVGRTQSQLLSKGAAADSSRSVYTGLIEIERGAKRTDARQTNHNLLLSAHAHADSVPNLDIRENDVACAHASSVGPLDQLQRWYLESRGVSRIDAERLMIEGFFKEMLDVLPSQIGRVFESDIASLVGEVVL